MRPQAAQLESPPKGERLYTIGEAAQLLGIAVPTLRLYEREGLVIPIRKSSRHRLYTSADIERSDAFVKRSTQRKSALPGSGICFR